VLKLFQKFLKTSFTNEKFGVYLGHGFSKKSTTNMTLEVVFLEGADELGLAISGNKKTPAEKSQQGQLTDFVRQA